MRKKLPKIVPKEMCEECGGGEAYFVHRPPYKSFSHRYVPRMETKLEAAYRQGYEEGYEEAADKAHWGSGW